METFKILFRFGDTFGMWAPCFRDPFHSMDRLLIILARDPILIGMDYLPGFIPHHCFENELDHCVQTQYRCSGTQKFRIHRIRQRLGCCRESQRSWCGSL